MAQLHIAWVQFYSMYVARIGMSWYTHGVSHNSVGNLMSQDDSQLVNILHVLYETSKYIDMSILQSIADNFTNSSITDCQ